MSLPPVSFTIRRAAAADAETLARLSHELGYAATAADSARRLARISERESQAVLVAESDSRGVVGWVHLFIALRLESESFAEIGGLVVGSDSRDRGVGRLLVTAAADWSRDRGLETLRVRSNVVRSEAHAFYRHLGFDRSKSQQVFQRRLDG